MGIVNKFPPKSGGGSVYGVVWDGTSTTVWDRTDDAAGFADPVPYVAGATDYGSPFDDISPWKDMNIVEDAEAGTLVSIPKFWYKLEQVGNGMSIKIANEAKDGFHVSPAHMDRSDGYGERDIVYIGRYHSCSKRKSMTGELPFTSITLAQAQTSAYGLGNTIRVSDWIMRFTIELLYLVEFADWDSQSKIGYGCREGSTNKRTGASDTMPYHTGTMKSNRTTYGVGTQYRNIEGLWDNVYDYVSGCENNTSGLSIYMNLDTGNPIDVSVGSPSNGYPSRFEVKNVAGAFPLFIPVEANGSDSNYSCDMWKFETDVPNVYAGGSKNQSKEEGLFKYGYASSVAQPATVGYRLMKMP